MLTKLLIADDHPIVRDGLRALFAATSDLDVVGECGDGLEAVDLVEKLIPDVLVLDLMLPGLSGLEVTRRVAKRGRTRVLVLSMHAEDAYVLEALRNGATGYLLKGSAGDELLRGVRSVASGKRYLAAPLAERAADVYVAGLSAPLAHKEHEPLPEAPYDTLTNREREVCQLAAEGMSNKGIGKRLFISPRTVEVHRGRMMKKLALATQTELVRFAIRRGLVIG